MANQTLNIKEGCYLVRFTRAESIPPVLHYDGTMRVENDGDNITASGDLYVHSTDRDREEPDPSKGIPIFPIPDYRYWLHVTEIVPRLDEADSFTAVFEPHSLNKDEKRFINMGTFVAAMTKTNAPPNYPSGSQYFTGDVTEKNDDTKLGSLTMGWVSENLRRAVLEIDRANPPEKDKQPKFPLRGGNPKDGKLDDSSLTAWQEALKNVKWKIAAASNNGGSASDSDIPEPDSSDGGFWTEGELHEQMLHSRVSSSSTMLDEEWHYYLLCVRRITTQERGVLFDVGGTDSDNMPREGAAIASAWPFPAKDPKDPVWGEIDDTLKGQPFGDLKDPYFRAAVHEIGHAMGLDHNVMDNGFMNTTDAIAEDIASGTFPANIQYDFAPDDQQHLRHGPDISVRPGGVAWTRGNAVFPDTKTLGDAAAALDSSEFDLQVSAPLIEPQRVKTLEPRVMGVPLGAPVRVNFILTNTANGLRKVPADLSLKSGNVSGNVVDANGKSRSFSTLMKCMDAGTLRDLAPGESASEWMTLLRGPDGALFPEAGFYRVIVRVSWSDCSAAHRGEFVEQLKSAGVNPAEAAKLAAKYACGSRDSLKVYSVQGETTVRVTKPFNDDENHSKIAEQILKTPDTLLSLAIGGDHLVKGNAVISAAVRNPAYQVLKPHWAFVEAKRLAQRHRARKADIIAACKWIDEDTVLSLSEAKRMLELITDALKVPGGEDKAQNPDVRKAIALLLDRIQDLGVDAKTLKLIPQLPDMIFSSEETAKPLDKLTRGVKEKGKHSEFKSFLERIANSGQIQKTSEPASKIFKELHSYWEKS